MQKKETILALDLGPNAVGAAWLETMECDEEKRKIEALETFVHTFPEGVQKLGEGKGKEISKNAARRGTRSARKQHKRKRLRKFILLKKLIQYQMTPFSTETLNNCTFESLVSSPIFLNWMKNPSPYEIRIKALKEPISLQELGRITYQFAQRRGYHLLSKEEKEDTKKMKTGDKEKGIVGFDDLEKQKKTFSEEATLGEIFHHWHPKKGEPYTPHSHRIRKRFIKKEYYTDEYDRIWEKQRTHHPALTEAVYKEIRSIVFFRRPLRTQKFLVGRCTFEPNKKRAPLSNPFFEAFRIESFINNLYYEDRPLEPEARNKARSLFFQEKELTVESFAKEMDTDPTKWNHDIVIPKPFPKGKEADKFVKLLGANYPKSYEQERVWKELANFNDKKEQASYFKEHYAPSESLESIQAKLKEIKFSTPNKLKVGAQSCLAINKIPKATDVIEENLLQIEKIWKILYYRADIEKKVIQEQLEDLGYNEEQIEQLLNIKLKEGYSPQSRKVLCLMLPFLKQGHLYTEALTLAGVQNAFGKDGWDTLSHEQKKDLITEITSYFPKNQTPRSTFKKGTILEKIKTLLKERHGLEEKRLKKLYSHQEEYAKKRSKTDNSDIETLLSEVFNNDKHIKNLRNPVVEQSLFAVRKVVKAICKKHGLPDKIHIEMGRDLKGNAEQRQEIREKQKENEAHWDKIRSEMEEEDSNIKNATAFSLLKAQGGLCIYSGQPISPTQLASGELEIDHIQPRSRTLDNSYSNKVLCLEAENSAKSNQTPYEYFQAIGRDWETFVARAANLFGKKSSKYRKLTSKTLGDETEFTERQLNDMRYISREVKKMLEPLVPEPILVMQGRITHLVRKKLKLNQVLSGKIEKDRADHAHHAVDAIVIALTTRSFLQRLRTHYKKKEQGKLEHLYDKIKRNQAIPHYIDLEEQVEKALAHIIITRQSSENNLITTRKVKSIQQDKRHLNPTSAARGELHKETFYGLRQAPTSNEKKVHKRIPLEEIKDLKKATNIVDRVVRKIVIDHITKSKKENIKLTYRDKEGNALLHLPNKRQEGKPVPIKKVRVGKSSTSLKKAREKDPTNRYVLNAGNHHILLYTLKEPTKKSRIGSICVSFTEAVERRRKREPIFQLPEEGAELLAYIRKGDYFLFGISEEGINWHDKEELSPYLYRVQKISGDDIFFKHHRVALLLDHNGKKVQIERFPEADPPYFETRWGAVIRKRVKKFWEEEAIPVHLSTLGDITKRAYKFSAAIDLN